MKKIITSLLISIPLLFVLSSTQIVSAGITDLNNNVTSELTKVSQKTSNDTWSAVESVIGIWKKWLRTFKIIIQWLLVIYAVYTGIQMVMSRGSNEEDLSAAKRQLYYIIIAIIFINIPWTLFEAFNQQWSDHIVTWKTTLSGWTSGSMDGNIFVNPLTFWHTLNDKIIGFVKVLIFMIALYEWVYGWIRILTARWREDKVTEAKHKLFYSFLGMVFIGVIESWKQLAFKWKIEDWTEIFSQLSNMALFFAGPTAIVFLMLWWYYYITANGEEEKINKGKAIVINTLIATVILLGSYTLLLDLKEISL